MNERRNHPTAVLRQFVNDVRAAYGQGEDRELDRETLHAEWPDLLVTFDHAVQALADASDPGHVEVCAEGSMESGVPAPTAWRTKCQCPTERRSRIMTWQKLTDRIATMTPDEQARPVRFVEPYDKDRVGHAVQLVRATEDIFVGERDGDELCVPAGEWMLR